MRAVDVRSFRSLEPIYGMGIIWRVFFFFLTSTGVFYCGFSFGQMLEGSWVFFLCFDFLFC